jgi:phosphoenolpyruvate synthase/pyruvate phosphate dikinase
MAFVYDFDHRHETEPRKLKALLGGKGANLAEMTSVLGLPVPPGFTLTTEACKAYLSRGMPPGLMDEVAEHLAALERAMGRKLGAAEDPLLVSVRSGAAFSIFVAPLQKKLLANTRAGLAGHWDEAQYHALSRSWTLWGAIATAAPLIAVFLVVIKPA